MSDPVEKMHFSTGITSTMSSNGVAELRGGVQNREKIYTYIEHRAGKAARLASWRKTQPGEFF
jgi:hypothetical protein